MHGVPENLPITRFHGATLDRFEDLQNVVYWRFTTAPRRWWPQRSRLLEIGVEGTWELRDKSGALVATGSPIPPASFTVSCLPLGQVVSSSSVRAPRSFVLVFKSGHELEVFDSSDKYESFSIPQANVYV
jgi:hypothetical protein